MEFLHWFYIVDSKVVSQFKKAIIYHSLFFYDNKLRDKIQNISYNLLGVFLNKCISFILMFVV